MYLEVKSAQLFIFNITMYAATFEPRAQHFATLVEYNLLKS